MVDLVVVDVSQFLVGDARKGSILEGDSENNSDVARPKAQELPWKPMKSQQLMHSMSSMC